MQEKFLHAVWRYAIFRPEALFTTSGEPITIISQGVYNTDAGPDFTEAKIKVGNTTLVGHVEMHVNSSDWSKHKHDSDDAYKNVILHVVYKDDGGETAQSIPTLCISPHIPEQVLEQYHGLIQSNNKLPCAAHIDDVKSIVKEGWLSRLLAERWEQKLCDWDNLLKSSNGDWRSLLYWRMAANFGFKVNAEPFLSLAQSISLNTLAKHGNNLHQIEALLFGQAGMLASTFNDDYPNRLKTEYLFLQKKYKLQPIALVQWKYMRMRPANFPTIRIAQFAALVHKSIHLLSQIVEKSNAKELIPLFEVEASLYWDNHYRFDELSKVTSKKKLGESSIYNIIINTIAPIKFLYAAQQTTEQKQEEALTLMDDIPSEKNHIIEVWAAHRWQPINASQSQAQIQLYNNYCKQKRCTECSIGISVIKS